MGKRAKLIRKGNVAGNVQEGFPGKAAVKKAKKLSNDIFDELGIRRAD